MLDYKHPRLGFLSWSTLLRWFKTQAGLFLLFWEEAGEEDGHFFGVFHPVKQKIRIVAGQILVYKSLFIRM